MRFLLVLALVATIIAVSSACETNADCEHGTGLICCKGACIAGQYCCGTSACNSAGECCSISETSYPACCSEICCKKYGSNWCCSFGQKCGNYHGHCPTA